MKSLILSFLLSIPVLVLAQTRTITSNTHGAWGDGTTWQGGNIANQISHDVTTSSNNRSATVVGGTSFTVGNITFDNGTTLTIEDGASLTLGSSSENKNFTTNNNTAIYVYGNLTINGNLIVHNNLILVVTGTLIITGDVQLNNNAGLTVDGIMDVGGDFHAGDNTTLNVDGTVTVGGDVTLGAGSTANGDGQIAYGGTCDDNGSGACQESILPVTLLSFIAQSENGKVVLNWSTASEKGFDFFSIQRSGNAIDYEEVGVVKGAGYNTTEAKSYSFTDYQPLNGRSYYRLKAVDLDGTFEIFDPAVVNTNQEQHSLQVYPNPLTGSEFSIVIDDAIPAKGATIKVTDIRGAEIFSTFVNELNSYRVDGNFPPGVYILLLNNQGIITKSRIVKN